MSYAKHWCFTVFDSEDFLVDDLYQDSRRLQDVTEYLVLGLEQCPNTGKKHIQGYLCLKSRARVTGVKKMIGTSTVHLESMKGSPLQASDYCKKTGTYQEFGVLPLGVRGGSQQHTALLEVKESIDSGRSLNELWEDHFVVMVRSHRSLEQYRLLQQHNTQRIIPKVEVLYGEPGTGKTRYVHLMAEVFYEQSLWAYTSGDWFDGYGGQRVALFDDYYGSISFGLFLRILDRYPVKVPVKGGFVAWNPERIYITSNKRPHFWYDNITLTQYEALERRFTKVYEINENFF